MKIKIGLFVVFICLISLITMCTNPGRSSSEPPDDGQKGNLLKNGDFSGGTSNWNQWENNGSDAKMSVENGILKISINNQGSVPWDIGLGQSGFKIQYKHMYVLSFTARSDSIKSITSIIQLGGEPWTSYSGAKIYNLTPTMTPFSHTFTMNYPTDKDADLEFFIGGNGTGDIYLDDITLIEYGSSDIDEEEEVFYPSITPSVDRSNIIIYEIVPGSYNGEMWDGGKCLKGVTERLDKIKSLGINCIWFTPVQEGEGMGYWPYNYYKISPKLGTLNNMKEVVYEAHKRDIMVLIDLVVNHTWTGHPFFQDVMINKSNSPYKDYYMWKGEPGNSDYDYYYDWDYVPNLNLSNADVREYLYEVAEYWVNKLDIDGYRVDCAWALEERYPGFSLEMKNRLAAIKPNVFLLAEGDVNQERFFNNGYNSAYDWDLRGFSEESGFPALFNNIASPPDIFSILTRNLPNGGLPFRFAENHDHPRAASLWGEGGSKVAHTIVMISRGYPCIHGGGEVGFAPDKNRKWSQNDPVDWNFDSPLYDYFKKIISIRDQYLKSDLNQYWINSDSNVVYSSLSINGSNKIITVANCSPGVVTVTLQLINQELGTINSLKELITDTDITYDNSGILTLSLDGYGTKIYLVK